MDNVVECIGDLAELRWKFPIGALIDSARDVPQEVIDGLETLQEITGFLCYDAPDLLWAFVKAMGIADAVGQRLEKTQFADPDPNANSPLVRDLIWQWKQDAK